MTNTIFTIGHSTRTLDEFSRLLREVGVTQLVDVRSFPRSRVHPQFNISTLPEELRTLGIGYVHLPTLGGRRHRASSAPPSPNTFWRVTSFRNYADYAETPPFQAGLRQLLTAAAADHCAVMCAEALWWRCHRRIIADYLIMSGTVVRHILGSSNVTIATLTPAARLTANGVLQYRTG